MKYSRIDVHTITYTDIEDPAYVLFPSSIVMPIFKLERNFPIRFSPFSESHAGEPEAVRLDLQQQVVRRHLHHPLPQQEGLVRGEDPQISPHDMLPGVRG